VEKEELMNDYFVHNIDPVIFTIYGPIAIRWYGVMYLLSFTLGYIFVIKNMNKKKVEISREKYDIFIFNIMLGVLIGGRFGYILFYNLEYYIMNPISIIAIWEGLSGMSFHGGAIGCIIAGLLFCKKCKYDFYSLADPAMPLVAVGIGLVRVGNFINGELVGRVTTVPWAVIFPWVDMQPRHPSQLYQALSEGFLMAIILQILLMKVKLKGFVFWSFIGLYGMSRFFIEYLRTPDDLPIYNEGLLFSIIPFTMGQVFSILMIVSAGIGFYFLYRKGVNK